MRRARRFACIASLMVVASVGCKHSPDDESGPWVGELEPDTCGDCVPLSIWVTNQSFDHPVASITVAVGRKRIVAGDYFVENQHTWVRYDFKAKPGKLELVATSATGGDSLCEGELDLPRTAWAVVSYWGNGSMTCNVLEEPPMFVMGAADDGDRRLAQVTPRQ